MLDNSNSYGLKVEFTPPKDYIILESCLRIAKNKINVTIPTEIRIAVFSVFGILGAIFSQQFGLKIEIVIGFTATAMFTEYFLKNRGSIDLRKGVYTHHFTSVSLKKLRAVQLVSYWEYIHSRHGKTSDTLNNSIYLLFNDQRFHFASFSSPIKSYNSAQKLAKLLEVDFIFLDSDIRYLKDYNWFYDGIVERSLSGDPSELDQWLS